MDRPRIRTFLYTSIDGKVDGNFKNETGSLSSRFFYDDELKRYHSSIIAGRRTTMIKYGDNSISLDEFKTDKLDKKNNISYQPDLKYYFCLDRKGKVFLNNNKITFGSDTYKVVEILSNKVDPRFVEYLKSKDIEYFFVDYKNDISEALDIIKKEYHIDDMLLISGPTTNGAFLNIDAIDSLSLIIAPYIEGNSNSKCMFDTNRIFNNSKFVLKESHNLSDGGIYLNFVKEQINNEIY